jgi:hypothetical protein
MRVDVLHLKLAGHAFPQLPQLASVLSVVSQPGWALQSPKPPLQRLVHTRFTQEAAALGNVQRWSQAPQFATSATRSTHFVPHLVGAEAAQSDTQVCVPFTEEQRGFVTSQTVPHFPQFIVVFSCASQSGVVSQFPHPELQVTGPQVPLVQVAVPFMTRQLLPQAPQLLALLSCVSHPGSVSLQSPNPALQLDMTQAPFTQAASALGMLQACPQVPQLATSVLRSRHDVPHLSGVVPLQLRTQLCVPPTLEQSGAVVGHCFPQLPQFATAVRSVSHRSSGLAEQCPRPGRHPSDGTTHLPAWHWTLPGLTLANDVQSWLQAPQVLGSLFLKQSPPHSCSSDIQPIEDGSLMGTSLAVAPPSTRPAIVPAAGASTTEPGLAASGRSSAILNWEQEPSSPTTSKIQYRRPTIILVALSLAPQNCRKTSMAL